MIAPNHPETRPVSFAPIRFFQCHCDPDLAAVRLAEALDRDDTAERQHDAEADAAITHDLEVDLALERSDLEDAHV